MFSVDNAGFVFSASALAIALILAGLMMVTGNNKSAEEMQDQFYQSGVTPGATTEACSTVTADPADSEGEVDPPKEELAAGASSSGAVSVSFTVVSPAEQADGQE